MAVRSGCNVAAGSSQVLALLALLVMIITAQGSLAQGSGAQRAVELSLAASPVTVAVRRPLADAAEHAASARTTPVAPARRSVAPAGDEAGMLAPIVGWIAVGFLATAVGALLSAVVGRRRGRRARSGPD